MNPFKRVPLLPILFALVLIFLGAITTVLAISDATYDLSWWTVNGGGGAPSGGSYNLSGTTGQYDAGDLSGGIYDLGGGYWATGGEKFTYIPVVLANFCGGFPGPNESEPNNDPPTANGPLCFFRTYEGNPNDGLPEFESDWFYINSSGGSFTVNVTNFIKSDAQLILYYETTGSFIDNVGDQQSGNYTISHNGPAGKYLIRLFAGANHAVGSNYKLRVTTP